MKITIIGAGNMGGALVEGFIKSGNINACDITICDKSATIREKFQKLGVEGFEDISDATNDADFVIVAVKPYLVDVVAKEAGDRYKGKIIISVAAGVDCETLKKSFGQECFRVIPNIAASFCESMTFISCNASLMPVSEKVADLLSNVGKAVVIDEKLLDAAMVTASCGTAYALRYIRAAMEASIEMGLTAEISKLSVAQTVKGAAGLLMQTDIHPEAAVDMVTTPGGITIVGLNQLENKGFSSSVIEAHRASYNKVKTDNKK